MILEGKGNHISQITDLWHEAFGDKKEDVTKYLEFLLRYFVVYEKKGEVCGMLCVLPLSIDNKNGGYIYAVATKKTHRGKGICKNLLNYVKGCTKYEFLILVPQSEGLFDFYKLSGFLPFSSNAKIKVTASKRTDDFSVLLISSPEYFKLRKSFFSDKKLAQWDEDVLNFAKSMYGAYFCKIMQNEQCVGIALCVADGDTLVIKELCAYNAEDVSAQLANYFGAEQAYVSYVDLMAQPSAMIYPDLIKDLYFGIALD